MSAKPTKTPNTAYEGEWDFAGACAPAENGPSYATNVSDSFTLGCFQWERRSKAGKNAPLKKGKVQYRIKGTPSDIAGAYKRARDYCAKHNAMDAKNAKNAKRT